jgi:apolipoprotein N-acyltransferase
VFGGIVLSLHSWRLSAVAFAKEWWAALVAAFCTYGLLLTAQPPRESAESAYFFLLPCLIWFSFGPSRKKVCTAFLLAGILYHLTLVGWIRHITFPGMLAAAFLLSLYNLPWFLLAGKLIPQATKGGFRQRLFTMIGLSAFWVSIEWARGQFTLGFPWCPLSVTQWERPAILQTLPWTGAWSVSFFLVFFNLTIASYLHHLLVRRRNRQGGAFSSFCPDFYVGILLFVLMVSPFFLFRTGSTENAAAEHTVRVGVCQPFLTNKWQSESVSLHKEILVRQTRFLALTNPDLIVWPEASTPYPVNLDPLWIEDLVRETGIPMLIGAVVREEGQAFNTISFVSPEEGVSPEWYAKRILVPFGEYVPFPFRLIPGLRKLVGPIGTFGEGKLPFNFNIPQTGEGKDAFAVGSLICYEDIFPSLVRETVQDEADFLFVCTNDAWFGREGCAEQHAAHSVLRAIENRIPLLRCGNAGWSGWIDRRGNQRQVLRDENGSIYFEGAWTLELKIPTSSTLSAEGYEDYFLWFCLASSAWLIFRSRKWSIDSD